MQEGNWWMADHEPARRGKGQMACCLLFTLISRGDVLEVWFFWTANAIADDANGPNRSSLSGLDVEKKRGEDAPPVARRVAQMAHGWRNF